MKFLTISRGGCDAQRGRLRCLAAREGMLWIGCNLQARIAAWFCVFNVDGRLKDLSLGARDKLNTLIQRGAGERLDINTSTIMRLSAGAIMYYGTMAFAMM
mmetsp:Transcript_4404/g.9766  ORF Transcript_4404/g.9766 Transcript_4404/m.9766 type:complete len:101 (+) Transcript_4404:1731-2033(+)